MNINVPVISILLVVALTIAAAAFRVSTAPERIRLRLDTAKATCVKGGGTWIKQGHDESCQAGATPQ